MLESKQASYQFAITQIKVIVNLYGPSIAHPTYLSLENKEAFKFISLKFWRSIIRLIASSMCCGSLQFVIGSNVIVMVQQRATLVMPLLKSSLEIVTMLLLVALRFTLLFCIS